MREKIKRLLLEGKTEEIVAIGEAAIPHLVHFSGDSELSRDLGLRQPIARIMVEIRGEEGIGYFIKLFEDFEFDVRECASDALAMIGEPAVPALIETLKHSYGLTRYNSARTLGKIADPRAIDSLIETFMFSIDDDTLVQITTALAKIGEASIPKLVAALEDPFQEFLFRDRVFEVLFRIGRAAVPALIGLLKHEGYDTRNLAAERLAKMPEAGLSEISWSLQEFVKSKDSEERERYRSWALSAYIHIAKAVAKRKQAEMGVELLEGKIKPPKKGIYRMRRAVV